MCQRVVAAGVHGALGGEHDERRQAQVVGPSTGQQ